MISEARGEEPTSPAAVMAPAGGGMVPALEMVLEMAPEMLLRMRVAKLPRTARKRS